MAWERSLKVIVVACRSGPRPTSSSRRKACALRKAFDFEACDREYLERGSPRAGVTIVMLHVMLGLPTRDIHHTVGCGRPEWEDETALGALSATLGAFKFEVPPSATLGEFKLERAVAERYATSSQALLPSSAATGIRHAARPDPRCSLTFS